MVKRVKRCILCILSLLLVISLPLQTFAATKESKDVDTENLLTQMELKRQNDIKSIWDQLVEQEKTENYEVHKRAYEDQYNQKVNAIRNGVIDESNINPLGDNDTLSWRRGGIIVYKSTPTSYYTEILEFYRPADVSNAWWDWSMGNIYTVGDFVQYAVSDVFFNIASASSLVGFARLGFDYYNMLDYELNRNKFKTADTNGDGITIHYYSGPFTSSEPSAVCWIWDDYPFVNPPNPNMYDYIRYYMN